MDLINIAENLIRFRSVTGNIEEIEKCLEYIKTNAAKTGAYVDIFRFEKASPVIFARNTLSQELDVLILGHIDVVPAEDHMFTPIIKDGKMFGRGTLDMKSFAAVALNSLKYVMENKLNLKFGFILSTDEETGSKSTKEFLKANPDLNAKIVLDNDVGGDITKIVARCKNPVFVKIKAKGKAAHGSTPWDGIDANEKLFNVWQNIRQIYPAYSLEEEKPANTWINTVHFAKIEGGDVANVIAVNSVALLDFRLTETSSVEDLCKNLDKCMEKDVSYEIVSSSTPVVMDENDPYIQAYKSCAEQTLNQKLEFEYIGGATDSREFAVKGSIVIMHSGTGNGMHAPEEYVEIESVNQIAKTQIEFLKKLSILLN